MSSAGDNALASFLPGMIPDDIPKPAGDIEIEALPIFTGKRLLELHPDRYHLAVALFFGLGASLRMCCRIARVSPHTMQCIVREEINGQTAEQWRDAACGELRVTGQLVLSAINERLSDSALLGKTDTRTLATILREVVHAHEQMSGKLPGQGGKSAKDLSDDELAREYINRQQRVESVPKVVSCDYSREGERDAGADPSAAEEVENDQKGVTHD